MGVRFVGRVIKIKLGRDDAAAAYWFCRRAEVGVFKSQDMSSGLQARSLCRRPD
jgi:hypothetical protein